MTNAYQYYGEPERFELSAAATRFFQIAAKAHERFGALPAYDGDIQLIPLDEHCGKRPTSGFLPSRQVLPKTTEALALMAAVCPDANVGISSRRAVGAIIVIDCDEPGVLERIQRETGRRLPLTYTTQTRPRSAPHKRHILRRIANSLLIVLRLGFEATPQKVTAIPRFPRLREAAPRSGFTTQKEYDALVPHASELWLRGALAVDYAYGLRRRELLDLRVFQIDLADGIIRLDDDDTKNGCGRAIAMTPEVRTLLAACCEGKKPDAYAFSRDACGTDPIKDFRVSWRRLFEAARLPLKLFHDNRRSAIRNMVRSGVDTTVAMKISGHKCDSVFRRYRIMDESDLHLAAQKIADGAARERARLSTDTETDTSTPAPETREGAVQ